jgi:16S rRNA (cytidine1402-2'-O)-methyltransferase
MTQKLSPALYLIPCTLGDTPVEQVLPAYNRDIILRLRHFIVEEVRTARRFLKAVDKGIDIDQLTFCPMGKHADPALFRTYLQPLVNGEPIGVISEAGCPAVADPGADLVALAQTLHLRVVPLVGPSSLLLAVMASGMNGQSFAFNGYLPIGNGPRTAAIKRLEARAWSENQTQLFIETPYRNAQLHAELLQTLRPDTRLCVAAGLTTADEWICTLCVAQWKKKPLPDLRKIPAIFLIHRK